MSAANEAVRLAKLHGSWTSLVSLGRHAPTCPGSRGEKVLHNRCTAVYTPNTLTLAAWR